MADRSEDDAKTRTRWAEDRTLLAIERTFASWIGTGLGGVGIAIALKAVFGATDPTWVAKVVASLFLIIAIILYWTARKQACTSIVRLTENDVITQSPRNFTLIALALTVATVATGAVLWSL
ncbi:DUF202 domain-containing protein [uncultured Tateyamaria sp.]|uniref:DUF202 domain-containing protein n=1 Tax=uncultured Tateyamaria sp. TaxID=455651 RepID=UPI00262A00B8|nr:DUF202 domain-containing protein [uncultured Tateyamaria sp.]